MAAVSTGEYLLTYLRTYDTQTPDLPSRFMDRLSRAVDALRRRGDEEERRPARGAPLDLEVAAAGRAPGRAGPRDPRAAARGRGSRGDRPPRRRSARSSTGSSRVSEDRWPALGDVARDLRYRVFDQPAFEAARRKVYAEMDEILDAGSWPSPARRSAQERVRLLVDCPQPLQSLYLGRFESAPAATREAMLEVLTRRYYRFRPLENFRSVSFEGRAGGARRVRLRGDPAPRRLDLVRSTATSSRPFATSRRTSPPLRPSTTSSSTSTPGAPGLSATPTPRAAELKAVVDGVGFGPRVVRVVAALAGAGAGLGMGGMQHFTFRPGEGGFAEDKLYRGSPPDDRQAARPLAPRGLRHRAAPVGRGRLPLPRRRPREPEGRAPLRPRRGARPDAGATTPRARLVGLPQMERTLLEAFEAIRLFQAHRKPEDRLQWNRVFLYVWPAVLVRGDGDPRLRPARGAGGGGARPREGRDPGPRSRRLGAGRTEGGRLLRLAGGADRHHRLRHSAERQAAPHPLRVRAEGRAPPPARPDLSVRDPPDAHARRRTPPTPTSRPGEFEEWDLDAQNVLVPVVAAAGKEPVEHRRRAPHELHVQDSRGNDARRPPRRPDGRDGLPRRAGVPPHPRRARPRREDGRAARVVRPLGGREDRHGLGHREHGLDLARPAPPHHVHAGGQRGERHRLRHQRRRPALLERRGDDAHAHAGGSSS